MDNIEEKRKMKHWWAVLSQYKYALLVALLGVALLLWPKSGGGNSAAAELPTPVKSSEETLEQRMEEALAKVRGVGRVDVTLTLHSGDELVLASNTTLRYSGNTHAPDDYDRSSETVTVNSAGGGQDVVVTQQRYPQYRGALVVCEGGGNDAVALQVVQAVSALTGLGSDKIAVVPWQDGGSAREEMS